MPNMMSKAIKIKTIVKYITVLGPKLTALHPKKEGS